MSRHLGGSACRQALAPLLPLTHSRAVQVSYNRPFATRFDNPGGQGFFFSTEFPMAQFLEKNGYDLGVQVYSRLSMKR